MTVCSTVASIAVTLTLAWDLHYTKDFTNSGESSRFMRTFLICHFREWPHEKAEITSDHCYDPYIIYCPWKLGIFGTLEPHIPGRIVFHCRIPRE